MFVHAARVIGGIGSPFFTKPSSGFRARKERKWTLHPGVFFFFFIGLRESENEACLYCFLSLAFPFLVEGEGGSTKGLIAVVSWASAGRLRHTGVWVLFV